MPTAASTKAGTRSFRGCFGMVDQGCEKGSYVDWKAGVELCLHRFVFKQFREHEVMSRYRTSLPAGVVGLITATLNREEVDGVDASRSISELAATAISKARDLARGLRSVGSHPEDLVDELRVLCGRVASVSKIRCRFYCPQPVVVHDGVAANHLFRIAQEAITNAVKHSGGTIIAVSLGAMGDVVELKITDDGGGFDSGGDQKPGLGQTY